MLEVEGIVAGYGSGPVLNGLSMRVENGARLAVLGRNGVGKTTLMRAIIGQIRLTSGSIRFDGEDLSKSRTHKRARAGIAYVPQGREIFPGLSVIDNLRVAAHAVGNKEWRSTLGEVMDAFPVLREKGRLSGAGLSGGQQQILALARALMTEPKLLLLDEPSEGIQPSIVDQIAMHVRKINEQLGIAVLVVEQNLEFATHVARDAYLMDKGEIVHSLPAANLLADRDLQHEYLGV